MKILTNIQFGNYAEILVSIIYRLKLYRIIARKWKNRTGEVDLICSKGNVLVFVEVKARSSVNSFYILSYKQQKRIQRSALSFLARYAKYSNYCIRFDLAIVHPFKLPKIIYNAWEEL